LELGAPDRLGCEDRLSLGIAVGGNDPVGVGACDTLGWSEGMVLGTDDRLGKLLGLASQKQQKSKTLC
jgi:hypothetical protein